MLLRCVFNDFFAKFFFNTIKIMKFIFKEVNILVYDSHSYFQVAEGGNHTMKAFI